MSPPGNADPAIYPKMRAHALSIRNDHLPADAVIVVLMDWRIGNGTASVLAAEDGTASIYLSSGGGFLGGGQQYPALREASLSAVELASNLMSHFEPARDTELPPLGEVYFYVTTSSGVHRATAPESGLKDGSDSLLELGSLMQEIVTLYRLTSATNPTAD